MTDLRPKHASPANATLILLAVLGLLALIGLSACGSSQPDQLTRTPTPTLTLTPTFPPTRTPTPLPPGSAENPLVIGLVSVTEDAQINAAGEELALQVAERTGLSVTGRVYTSYHSLLEDMEEARVHVAWMPPLTYVYASGRGVAQAALLTNHFGVYEYGAQFLANAASGLQPHYDPLSGQNDVDAATALAQFQGLRPCWVEPLSPTGYILPAGLLLNNQVETIPAVFAQSHTAVVRALYVQGICDFGATFSHSGDPRTAAVVQDDLPDVMNRVLIIWRSDASVPNVSLVYRTGLSEGNRIALTNAFLDIVKTPDGKGLLTLSAGNYEIEDLRVVEDHTYDPLRDVVAAVRINLLETIGR